MRKFCEEMALSPDIGFTLLLTTPDGTCAFQLLDLLPDVIVDQPRHAADVQSLRVRIA